jgi:hypothetical protein
MTAKTSALNRSFPRVPDKSLQFTARSTLALAGMALAYGFAAYLLNAGKAVRFAHELDYGEGIVWQQMRMIVSGSGYSTIDGFPAIVFHYPPVYHVLAAATAQLTGLDELAAGRLLSVSATLFAAAVAALIVAHAVRLDASRKASQICGALAALMLFSLQPLTFWSVLMRVDMVALALSLLGLYFGLRSLTAHRQVYLAALCFVAAVYTKQTTIAAPAAVFATLLWLQPRTGVAGIACVLSLGLTGLAGLQWLTDGGFLRHILLYNLNRFEAHRLLAIVQTAGIHIAYIGAAALGALWHHRGRSTYRTGNAGLRPFGQSGLAGSTDAALLMLRAYLLFVSLMLLTIAKSGSNINYLIEWLCALVLLAAVAMRGAAMIATSAVRNSPAAGLKALLPLAIVLQMMAMPASSDHDDLMRAERRGELARLSAMIRASARPVISDDMVILIRSGQRVLWEPAIFAELASGGVWDERVFVERIRASAFGFFVTVNTRGDRRFDSRYNPAVANAIDASYPNKRVLAGYTLHLPAVPRP